MLPFLIPIIMGPPVGKVTLSGTAGDPNIKSETATLGANIAWTFNTDGTVDVDGVQFETGTEWNAMQGNIMPRRNFYIRATLSAGEAPGSGDDLNTWLQVAGPGGSNRSWAWVSEGNILSGSVKIEIALSSAGEGILATGFYGAEFT